MTDSATNQSVVAQQNQQVGSQPANTDAGQESTHTRHRAPARPSQDEDARTIINNRRAAREAAQGRLVRESALDFSAKSRDDLIHTINRNRSRASLHRTGHHEEETSSSDPTYVESGRETVEARVKELENQIDRIAKKFDQGSFHNQVGTETESPFSSNITRFAIPRKFK